MRPSTQKEWQAAYEVCLRVETNEHICSMKNAHTEHAALGTASAVLNWCDKNPERVDRYAARLPWRPRLL